MLNFNSTLGSNASQFKFKQMRPTHPICLDVIKSIWNLKVSGYHMFIVSENLNLLKRNMEVCNIETFGNVHILVRNAEEKLDNVQFKIQADGYSKNLRFEEKICMKNLEEALLKEQLFWK